MDENKHAERWLRAGLNTTVPAWGLRGGIQFGLHPAAFDSRVNGGPRGLIRVAYPTLPDGGYTLINYIAIEPVVGGSKGYSEMEPSVVDGKNGKILQTGGSVGVTPADQPLDPGDVRTVAPGVEELTVTVFIESFRNGAHVRLRLAQRSDAPDEMRLTVETEADSAALESCILTSTMGNQTRARLLFLADGPVSSLQLYPDYRGVHFAPHRIFPLERLPRAANGDVLVSIANDEDDPTLPLPLGRPSNWQCRGAKVAQYWRRPAAQVGPQLQCAVNARFTYWKSDSPIPGGIAIENFELREPFRPGQDFIFGMTTRHPQI